MPQNVHFKLGQSGNYKYSADIPVGTGQYQGVTVSLNSWSGLNTVEADPHHRSWTLVDNATNRVVDTTNVSAFVKSQVIGFGYMFSQSMNFKGRFRTSGMGNKIRRKRSSLDFSAELLFAPVIRVYDRFGNNDIDANTKIHPFNVTKEAGAFDDATVAKYYFKDIQKSRVGWRFQAEMTKGIINYRFEFGSRPGLSTYLNQENEKSKFYERPLNRMYLQMGIGIGIGAL